ncbi:DUF4111 domain-containing protein [Streptomyces alkaliphilus]|uniref:DUF4111 domain-containing protein n=1 Tax=Streptomyces alkaliphilus TaxID=1472722 RepID=A0A7W3TGG7_9ACTN|nr:aminoglycoside adenylyltransferase domain-containing protein [Streptomyces alkaliphilus]MBB0246374.1 DUF4111 domain-containing protein [Streptomyces alkaliphilus]
MDELIAPVVEHLRREDPGGVVGLYLYGSAVTGGLRPDSDVDLLLLTHRSLTAAERADLVRLLLGISGWRGHARRFPDAVHRRPVELTGIVVGDGAPSRSEWPRRDFLYGEWLREELVAGRTPGPADDPDLVILLATAHAAHRVLHGPPLDDLLAPPPPDRLRAASLAVIPDLLAGIEGDERNVLLTLARILVTLETRRIVPKDVAAGAVAPTLRGSERELLERARAGYLGIATDRWADLAPGAVALARALADRLSRSDQPPETGP